MSRIFIIALLLGATFLWFNREKVSEFKRNTIETINPAAKEKRLLGEMEKNLAQLDALLNEKSGPEQNKKIASILNSAKQTLSELQETNAKLDIGANLSNLLQKVIPLAEKASPTWVPPLTKECPVN